MINPTPPYFPLTDSSMFFAAPKFSNSVYGSRDCIFEREKCGDKLMGGGLRSYVRVVFVLCCSGLDYSDVKQIMSVI
jgi:hypothetical protein